MVGKHSVEPDHVQPGEKRMHEDWSPNENLGDWIRRRFEETGWNASSLTYRDYQDADSLDKKPIASTASPATVYRMLQSKEFFMHSSDVRDAIAWNKLTNTKFLGYFGYPPLQEDAEPHNPYSITKVEMHMRMHSDFLATLLHECGPAIDECYFCKPKAKYFKNEKDWCDQKSNEYIAKQKQSKEILPYDDVERTIFLSTHKTKQYGAIKASWCKTFDVELQICLGCAIKYSEVLLMPVSDLVKAIIDKHGINQKIISEELSLDNGQGLISKLQGRRIEFVNPLVVKKLIGLWLLGTLQQSEDNSYQSGTSEEEIHLWLDKRGFSKRNFVENSAASISSPRYLKGLNQRFLNWRNEYSLEASCDLMAVSNDGNTTIACYFVRISSSSADEKLKYLLIATAKNLGATHICFQAAEHLEKKGTPYYKLQMLCLDISGSLPIECAIPKNE